MGLLEPGAPVRPAERAGRGLRDGIRGDPDHLHDLRGFPVQRASPSLLGVARPRSDPVADGGPGGAAGRDPRHLLRDHDRLRPRRRRNDDRADGHGKHAGDGYESLHRFPGTVGDHRRGDPGGPAWRHALPDALPRGPLPVHRHVPREHRRGDRPPADAPEVRAAVKNLSRRGEPSIWVTGGALAVSLVMTMGLILLILVNGLGVFWPSEIVKVNLKDGSTAMGILRNRESIPTPGDPKAPLKHRIQLQVGNRDLYGQDFRWIDEDAIQGREVPADAVLLERREWGVFCGFLKELRVDGKAVATGTEEVWREVTPKLDLARRLWDELRQIEKDDMGEISRRQEALRLKVRGREMAGKPADDLEAKISALREDFNRKSEEIRKLRAEMERSRVILASVDGREKDMLLSEVVRALRPNTMGFFGKAGVYAGRVWEVLGDEPRESNTEGGVFPAIFGTVMMVFIMTLAVVPLGVLAALYLREYARQGPLVRAVRIAVNNLAGVPSIVFGIFGLGFFVYLIGGSMDRLFYPEALPAPTFGTGGILWASLTLALLTVPALIVATEEGLAAVPRIVSEASLAMGATKFQTILRVVLPAAAPGILTGLILAMARGAGEVAPLMLTGVVKLAPDLPLDAYFPFFHLDRKFMHLGFHIYDVRFQSPHVEAAKPMVATTTILLLLIVVALNFAAIVVRNRLRRRYQTSAF